MHRQKLLTRSIGDNDNGGVERGGICSRWSPDASSSDYASDSASAAPSRRCRRRRRCCCFGAFYGCDGYDGDGAVLSDCCGLAAVFGSRSFFTGISGRRRSEFGRLSDRLVAVQHVVKTRPIHALARRNQGKVLDDGGKRGDGNGGEGDDGGKGYDGGGGGDNGGKGDDGGKGSDDLEDDDDE